MFKFRRTISLNRLLEKEIQTQTDDRLFDTPHKTPFPRAGYSKQHDIAKKAKHYHRQDSESDSEGPLNYDDTGLKKNSKSLYPSTGYLESKKHPKKYVGDSLTNLRTLYSHFPLHYCRTIIVHLMLTFFFFSFVFPVVNFFWTYMASQVDHEIDRLLHYISDDEVRDDSLYRHFNRLQWLTMPQFTVEVISLVFASIIADTVCLRWIQELEAISLNKIVENQRVKKYY